MAGRTGRNDETEGRLAPRSDQFSSSSGAAEEADVAVIGGGPAGATFARLAGQSRRVVLLDARPPEGGIAERAFIEAGAVLPVRGKCCGGLLAPDAQAELAAQGLTLPLDVLVDPQIFAVQVLDLQRPALRRLYPRSYVNMDRDRFDRWLLSLVPEGVVRMGARVRSAERSADGRFLLRYSAGGRERALLARILVGADGGNSLVRRTFFPGRPIRQYAAVQEWYAAGDAPPLYGALFDRTLTDCTGWMIAKNGALVLGAALPFDGATARFASLKTRLAEQGFAFGPRLRREGCVVSRPAGLRELCLGENGVFLAGEAAGFLSPSSLEGISWALKSGAALARSLTDDPALTAGQYAALTAGLRRKLAGKLAKCPFMYAPFLREAILRSGIASLGYAPSPAARTVFSKY